jgi:hypothetical protein
MSIQRPMHVGAAVRGEIAITHGTPFIFGIYSFASF